MVDELGRRVVWDSPAEELRSGVHEGEVVALDHVDLDGRPFTVLDSCRPTA